MSLSAPGLYEQRIVLPQWFNRSAAGLFVNTAAMRSADVGRNFLGFVTTLPLTLLTLANLGAAWTSQGSRHDWWLAAAGVTLIERVATFTYFIPTAIRLTRADTLASPQAAGVMAARWIALNRVRLAVSFVAWLAALKALTL